MYDLFRKARPDIKIGLTQYKGELPWNLKKAYRSTCLDRCDVNFDWHRQGLRVAMELLAPLLAPPSEDAEGDAEAEAAPADPLLRELSKFAALTSRTEIGNELVCMPTSVDPGDQRLGDEHGAGVPRRQVRLLRLLALLVQGPAPQGRPAVQGRQR